MLLKRSARSSVFLCHPSWTIAFSRRLPGHDSVLSRPTGAPRIGLHQIRNIAESVVPAFDIRIIHPHHADSGRIGPQRFAHRAGGDDMQERCDAVGVAVIVASEGVTHAGSAEQIQIADARGERDVEILIRLVRILEEPWDVLKNGDEAHAVRSEEHTSELQSRFGISYAV